VPTNLARLGVAVSVRLMSHGFALAMARIHLAWGYPLLDVNERFFVELAMGTTPSREATPSAVGARESSRSGDTADAG
jgi:hypothetical protein